MKTRVLTEKGFGVMRIDTRNGELHIQAKGGKTILFVKCYFDRQGNQRAKIRISEKLNQSLLKRRKK